MKTLVLILQLLVCLALIASVLLQSGKSAGLSGSIAGGAEMFFGKKKGMDDFLRKVTIVLSAVFFVLTVILVILL